MRCQECDVNYPHRLLSPITMSDSGQTTTRRDICAICALELLNEFHGVKQGSFTGEMAEQMRLDAIAHRKRTGQTSKRSKRQ